MYVRCVVKFLLCLFFVSGGLSGAAGKEQGIPDGAVRITAEAYRSAFCKWMFQDGEPASVLFDKEQRSFYINQPLQIKITRKGDLFLRFYSPRPLEHLTLWVYSEALKEEYKLAEFEIIFPFAELTLPLPGSKSKARYITRSGKKVVLEGKSCFYGRKPVFRIDCEDPYYIKLSAIRCRWEVSFGNYSGPQWTPLLPVYAREAVALALNTAYLFSTSEFETCLSAFQGKLYADNVGTPVDIGKLYHRILQLPALEYGCVKGVNGLGGGRIVGLAEWCYRQHYADSEGITHTWFHEFAHCLGYGHSGNMTYENGLGKGWVALCGELYRKMCKEKKLPVYSCRFLSPNATERTYENTFVSQLIP